MEQDKMSLYRFKGIGENIKKFRKARGITQQEMAKDILRIPVSTYSNYENGNRVPEYETVERIADFLEIEMIELIGVGEVDRIEFLSSFDMDDFDTNIIMKLNEFKKKFVSHISSTTIVQNIIIGFLAKYAAAEKAGNKIQLDEFIQVENEYLTGKRLYVELYQQYYEEYIVEQKRELYRLVNKILRSNSDILSAGESKLLNEFVSRYGKEELPESYRHLVDSDDSKEGE